MLDEPLRLGEPSVKEGEYLVQATSNQNAHEALSHIVWLVPSANLVRQRPFLRRDTIANTRKQIRTRTDFSARDTFKPMHPQLRFRWPRGSSRPLHHPFQLGGTEFAEQRQPAVPLNSGANGILGLQLANVLH